MLSSTSMKRPDPPSPFNPSELTLVAPREELTISQWAARHLRITEGPMVGSDGSPVAWSPDVFPLQSIAMEAIEDPRWSKVLLLTPPQAWGKTQAAAIPTLLHAISHRGVSALYVAATSNLGTTQWRKKIEPAILADGEMESLIPENTDDRGDRTRRDFTNGTSLHIAGAESVGNLSAFTVPVVVCDDLQAYPATLPGFGHPADLAWRRSESYPADLTTLVAIGTAGTVDDYLWRSMKTSALFCPFLPCPGCGVYQLLEWDRLQFDAEDPDEAKADTWMQCAAGCDCQIRFDDLPAMLTGHKWASCPPGDCWVTKPEPGGTLLPEAADVYPATRRNTNVAGFWSNALYWPLGAAWGERAAEYLSRLGDPDKLKDHQQQIRVVPYEEPEEDESALTVEAVAAHQAKEHRYRTVPAEADIVTVAADVHDRFLYYVVRAWTLATGESWLVDAGTLGVHSPKTDEDLTTKERAARVGSAIRDALEALWAMEEEGWPTVKADGELVKIHHSEIALVDGGYRPDAVFQHCTLRNSSKRRVWCMIKGRSDSKAARPIWPRKPTESKRRGHRYWEVNVDEAKHLVRELLAIPQGQAGAWHLYSGRPLDAYLRHLVAEHFIATKGGQGAKAWRRRTGAGPNHWWDCEVYSVAAAIACGVKLRTRDTIPTPVHRRRRRTRRITMPDGRPFRVATR